MATGKMYLRLGSYQGSITENFSSSSLLDRLFHEDSTVTRKENKVKTILK